MLKLDLSAFALFCFLSDPHRDDGEGRDGMHRGRRGRGDRGGPQEALPHAVRPEVRDGRCKEKRKSLTRGFVVMDDKRGHDKLFSAAIASKSQLSCRRKWHVKGAWWAHVGARLPPVANVLATTPSELATDVVTGT